MSRPSSPQSSAAPDADSTTYPATCQARHALGSKATPQTHCNAVRLYSSRYSVSLCARKPMLMCPWQLSSRQPSCRCLQIEGRMSLRQQLLTSEAVGHIAVFGTLALAKESSTAGCSLHITTQLYLWPSCCSVAFCCAGVALYSVRLPGIQVGAWAMALLLGFTLLCNNYDAVRQTIAYADRG